MFTGVPVPLFSKLFATMVIWSVSILIEQHDSKERHKDAVLAFSNFNKLYNKREQTFDYIVVGSGSAGSVITNRLSENNNVLLLEAGGSPSPVSEIPFFKPFLPGTKMDYNYKTVPQKFMGLAYKDRIQVIPRGKVLGGSSQINAMMYVRGNKLDYERWEKLLDDPTWSYENVLKAFKKQEDYHGSYPNPNYHGTNGSLFVEKQPYVPKITKYLFQALAEKNVPIGDYNGKILGNTLSPPEVLVKRGRRWGGYAAFLEPILKRKQLTIYKFAQVTKVLMDSTRKAYGVEYVLHGVKFKAFAKREVILCAGVYETPKLLMLSGIGDSKHLQSVGIQPLVHLPGVGKNLIENLVVPLYVPTKESLTFVLKRDLKPKHLKEYTEHGTGPFSSVKFRPVVGFINSKNNRPINWPDLYIIIEAFGIPAEPSLSQMGDAFRNYLQKYKGKDGLTIYVNNLKIKSLPGEVRLKSCSPKDSPIIDPNYLNNGDDLEPFIDGIRFIENLIETTRALSNAGAFIIQKKIPGCEEFVFKSREYWKCYVRAVGSSTYQAFGTCKMAKSNDPYGVVDGEFRVLKVKDLRVIDSSVVPFLLTGEAHAITMMIAEIGSSKILNRPLV